MNVRTGPWAVLRQFLFLTVALACFESDVIAQDNPPGMLTVTRYGEKSFAGIRAFVKCDSSVILATIDEIYRSSNDGASWTELVAPLSHKSVVDVVPLGDTVFVLTSNGVVHRTTNDGLTWSVVKREKSTSVNDLYLNNTAVDARFVPNINITDHDRYRSVTVSDSSLTVTTAGGVSHVISSSAIREPSCVALTDSVVYVGRSRLPILAVRLVDHDIREIGMTYLAQEYVSDVHVHNGFLYAGILAGQGGIHRKPLAGNQWEIVNIDRNTENVDVQCIVSGSKRVYVGFREHGVAFIPDGGHVAYPIHEGLSGAVAQTVDQYGDDLLLTARLRGLVRVRACGGVVDRFSTNLPHSSEYVTGVLGKTVVVGLHSGQVIRTTDDGHTWDTLGIRFTESAFNRVCAYDSTVFICTNDGAWSSSDSGRTWSRAFANLPQQSIQDIHRIPRGYIVRTNEEAYIYHNDGSYTSFQPAGEFEHKPHILDVFATDSAIYAVGYPGLFVSTDDGASWKTYTIAENSILRTVSVYDSKIYITGIRGHIYHVPIQSID